MVVENHVRLLDRLQTAKGQQPGIARPGADQNNFSRLAFGLIQLILQRLFPPPQSCPPPSGWRSGR
ncbi:Uncharacterised protein [Klebsiella pneumoniae subsp. rhinoscleromatis]|nr:Uncharacterised protein [Klebsiella pneumoniae subsp. rhinoscleromatis]